MDEQKTAASADAAGETKQHEKSDLVVDMKTGSIAAEMPTGKTIRTKKRKSGLKRHRASIVFAVVVLIILVAAYRYKGLLVAAMVDGSPISRISVIEELEKQSGSQALDALITKKLIDAEATKKKIVISQADIDSEITKLTDQVTKQGGTLKMALDQQGMTEAQLREQLLLQKKLEKILGDKVAVTDDDVNQYITTNKASVPAGISDADFKAQLKEQLKGQKFNTEAGKWVADAKAKANISYYADHIAEPEALPAETAAPQGE
jgi:hypothetical protein